MPINANASANNLTKKKTKNIPKKDKAHIYRGHILGFNFVPKL